MRARFECKVQRGPNLNDCWNWLGAVDKCGYGVFWNGEYTAAGHPKSVRAHRASYELYVGPIPSGMEVDHTCFTRSCVRPDHLRLGTHRQNLANRAGAASSSSSGVRGVYRDGKSGKWRAAVKVNGRMKYNGLHESLEDAAAAAVALRRRYLPASLR